jgi:ribosome-binding protein aMBF1 (putative translation factor)
MECHICQNKIKGEGHDHDVSVCHPAMTYNKVKICSNCYHFPKNNVESKETLIK